MQPEKDKVNKPRRLGLLLKEALGYDSANENHDQTQKSEIFDAYRENLRSVIEALQAQSVATKKLTEARMRVSSTYMYNERFPSFFIYSTLIPLLNVPIRW